jgi:hypothetical protein
MLEDTGNFLLSKMLNSAARSSSDDQRLINWRIVNHGKQTILVL